MSVLDGRPAGGGELPPPASGATTLPAADAAGPDTTIDRVPVRASGLELIGEMAGSGYRRPPALVRRQDGQTVQLTPLLYLVLEAVDGDRDYDEIAAQAGGRFGRTVTGADVRTLVEEKLRPLGLVCPPDGSEPAVRKANPLLALRFRWVVSDPERTRRITAPFARLFNPLLVLAVFAITLVSAGFHEFGHAAAARYGGATPGAMGAGLYLIWPAFYTDVTDS